MDYHAIMVSYLAGAAQAPPQVRIGSAFRWIFASTRHALR
jgi:hypothetical protein